MPTKIQRKRAQRAKYYEENKAKLNEQQPPAETTTKNKGGRPKKKIPPPKGRITNKWKGMWPSLQRHAVKKLMRLQQMHKDKKNCARPAPTIPLQAV